MINILFTRIKCCALFVHFVRIAVCINIFITVGLVEFFPFKALKSKVALVFNNDIVEHLTAVVMICRLNFNINS